MPTRTCHGCGEPFESTRSHAIWCSTRCRSRAKRLGPVPVPDAPPRVPGPMCAAVAADVARLGAAGTPEADAALLLALHLDDPDVSAAAVPALVRELRAVLALLADTAAAAAPSPLDALRARRGLRPL